MRRGHVAIRTCRGCGRKAARSELVRLVVADGRLTDDLRGNAPGRGIYCCNDDNCRQRLEKSKRILNSGRNLRLGRGKGEVNGEDSCI